MEIPIKYFQFKHPFTCMTAGPTSSGKTYLIRDILKYHKLLININENILNVVWAYGQWQELYSKQIENCKTIYLEGLPSEEDLNEYTPHLVVIDDLMSELANDKKLTNLFTKGSHHKNISVIFISQNIFMQGSQMRTVSLNCHNIILLKNPRDRAQVMRLAYQIYPNKSKFLIEAYDDATKAEFGYIRIDLTQNTPDKYRVQTRLTPHKDNKFIIIIYMPK